MREEIRVEGAGVKEKEFMAEAHEWPKARFRFRLTGAGRAGGSVDNRMRESEATNRDRARTKYSSRESLGG